MNAQERIKMLEKRVEDYRYIAHMQAYKIERLEEKVQELEYALQDEERRQEEVADYERRRKNSTA